MKIYMFLGLLFTLLIFAEENPFALNENFKKIDLAQKKLLTSLKNHTVESKSRIKNNKLNYHKRKIQAKRIRDKVSEKQLAKVKQERAKARQIKVTTAKKLRLKKNKLIKEQQEKAKASKIEKDKEKNKNNTDVAINLLEEQIEEKNIADQEYLDAIKDVDTLDN